MRQRAREPQRPAPAHHAAIVGALVVGAAGQAGVVTSGEGDEGHRGVRGVDLAEGVRLRGLGHREIEERDVDVSFGQALDGLGHRADVVDLDGHENFRHREGKHLRIAEAAHLLAFA